ncbi:MAG: (2Fe-2S)-binding protein [Acidobacteriia bacterium]|nr:(2Fe-2S)-binding protein [Terriglobia bacterium]
MPEEKSPQSTSEKFTLSRREFVATVGGAAATSAVLSTVDLGVLETPVFAAETPPVDKFHSLITLRVNGDTHRLVIDNRATLADVLRTELGLTGTKIGCSRGECGACTVIMDGRAVYSCSILAVDAQHGKIETIEGMAVGGRLHPLQQAFLDHDAMQCGFCIPGQLMALKAALDRNPNLSREELRYAISGNICRCGCYANIIDAAEQARPVMKKV